MTENNNSKQENKENIDNKMMNDDNFSFNVTYEDDICNPHVLNLF